MHYTLAAVLAATAAVATAKHSTHATSSSIELKPAHSLPDEVIVRAAVKCCPEEHYGCCYSVIDFKRRLPENCDKMAESLLNSTMNCIQNELYGEGDAETVGVNHIGCCEALNYDDTDQTLECYETCKLIMKTPGFKSIHKLERVKHCRFRYQLGDCFNLCRVQQNEHTSKGLSIDSFTWKEPRQCERYKMAKDELYVRKQHMRRMRRI